MRAIVLEKFGGLDSLVYREIPEPEPAPGHVVIEVKAFGINHAEMHMRRGEWAEAAWTRCDRGQGFRDQSRGDAHAPRRMGRGRPSERD